MGDFTTKEPSSDSLWRPASFFGWWIIVTTTTWWNFKKFSFSPWTLGREFESNLAHIFQMGWFNYQPEMYCRWRKVPMNQLGCLRRLALVSQILCLSTIWQFNTALNLSGKIIIIILGTLINLHGSFPVFSQDPIDIPKKWYCWWFRNPVCTSWGW